MRFIKGLVLLGLLFQLLPTAAQEDTRYLRIGFIGNADDFGVLLPQFCVAADECQIAELLFPRLLGLDPATQTYATGAPGNALTEQWEVSPDGLTYTLTLRQDMVWSDGEPIDAEDVQFSFNATGYYGAMSFVNIIDPYTVEVIFTERSCGALFSMDIGVIPAHAFDLDPTGVGDSLFALRPSITAGPFLFDHVDSENNEILLRANPNYAPGEVQAAGIALVGVTDSAEMRDRFLSGELDMINSIQQEDFAAVEAMPGVQFMKFPGSGWDYIGLNLADPLRPREGQAFDGSLSDQGVHPILGDVQIRRALQHALNVPALIEEAVYGEATLMPSYELPLAWSYAADLAPVPYDPALAQQLIEAAGWVRGSDGIWTAATSDYAPAGTRLSLSLLTNDTNTRRAALGSLMQAQFREIGVELAVETLDFDELLATVASQTYDAYLLGWSNDLPFDPTPNIFLSINDAPGDVAANNYTSYQNSELERLDLMSDRGTDCSVAVRRPIYGVIQKMVQQDQPYLWLFALNRAYAAQPYIRNFAPYPNFFYWNAHLWEIGE